jgi:glutathione S-transferase
MSQSKIRVFTFPPAWGLPTCGPFGLKLEVCLRMLEVPYERAYEADNSKGPKRKSPWIDDNGVVIGDTELILAHLERTRGVTIDRDLDANTRAHAHVFRESLEEHFHQIFEYELIVHDAGFPVLGAALAQHIPMEILQQMGPGLQAHLKSHLFERGILRHGVEDIDAKGRADVDAMVQILGDKNWFFGDRPTKADASAFGLLALLMKSELPTPTATYARSQPTLVKFVERTLAHFFPELSAGQTAS